MRTLAALLLSVGLVACGGSRKPALDNRVTAESAEEEASAHDASMAATCCCFVQTASGDLHDDYQLTSVDACQRFNGTCEAGPGSCPP